LLQFIVAQSYWVGGIMFWIDSKNFEEC